MDEPFEIKIYEFDFPSPGQRIPVIHHDLGGWNEGCMPSLRNCWMFAADYLHGCTPFLEVGTYYLPDIASRLLPETGDSAFSGQPLRVLKKSIVNKGFLAVEHDDLNSLPFVPSAHYLIAAYGYSGKKDNSDDTIIYDYHFYRHHAGKWYHKNGWGACVSRYDDKNHFIRDPRKCDRSRYDAFAGFFLSPPDRVKPEVALYDSANRIVPPYRGVPHSIANAAITGTAVYG